MGEKPFLIGESCFRRGLPFSVGESCPESPVDPVNYFIQLVNTIRFGKIMRGAMADAAIDVFRPVGSAPYQFQNTGITLVGGQSFEYFGCGQEWHFIVHEDENGKIAGR